MLFLRKNLGIVHYNIMGRKSKGVFKTRKKDSKKGRKQGLGARRGADIAEKR